MSYFTEVWELQHPDDFALLAPLNSMASNIGGSTLHSFGRIAFKDNRGNFVNTTRQRENEETSTLSYRWNKRRGLFIDEIEAVGADVLGHLATNLQLHVPDVTVDGVNYKFEDSKDRGSVRQFAGVNLMLFGDFF